MDEPAYVVAVKRSARQRAAAVGEWVRDHGSRRAFRSKAAARRWADRASEPGRRVWIQDANPRDSADVDGYLVGGDRPAPPTRPDREEDQVEVGAFRG